MSQLDALTKFADTIFHKLKRHRHEPAYVVVSKTKEFLASTISAPFYLRHVTKVGKRVRTIGKPRIVNYGSMILGDDISIRSIHVPIELATEPGAELIIGNRTRLNYGASIGATQRIELGQRVRVGPFAMIIDSNFHSLYNRGERPPSKPVIIEDDVWVGAKSVIMPGVRVGRGSVIGTMSVVTKDVPPFCVVAGSPAKVVKELDPERFVISDDAT